MLKKINRKKFCADSRVPDMEGYRETGKSRRRGHGIGSAAIAICGTVAGETRKAREQNMMRHPVKLGMGITCALAFAMPLGMANTTLGQETVLIGEAREGGHVFQTIIKSGAGDLRSEQRAIGSKSQIELHANVNDDVPPTVKSKPKAKAMPPQTAVEAAANATASASAGSANAKASANASGDESAGSSTNPKAEAADPAEAGGHLIVRRDQRGEWRALGLTADGDKARSAVNVLREGGIESAVFQFLPIPAEIQRLPLASGVEPVGLAVRLNGEVFAVAKDGRLVAVPLR